MPRAGEASPEHGRVGRVLVTDGEFKHTLGIVRALHARGHEVHVLAQSARAPSVHSRATTEWQPAPPPGNPVYDERLCLAAMALAPVILIPVGDGSNAAAQRLRERLPETVRRAIPSAEAFAVANDKARTAELARTLGIATPRECLVSGAEDARRAWAEFGAPLVVKARHEVGRKVIRYVRAERDLGGAVAAVREASGESPLAQEYVAGDGYGFSALYWEGRLVRQLMHRRVREWPPSGGTSACAESIPQQPELERAGRALLDALDWHGVAMVEFKHDMKGGRFVLMEINAKFWGSHDVALAAGVDFPGDLAALLGGERLGPQPEVKAVRVSWPLGGDLHYGLARPSALPRVILDALSPHVRHTFRWSDPLPHLYEAAQWLRSIPGARRELEQTR